MSRIYTFENHRSRLIAWRLASSAGRKPVAETQILHIRGGTPLCRYKNSSVREVVFDDGADGGPKYHASKTVVVGSSFGPHRDGGRLPWRPNPTVRVLPGRCSRGVG